MGAEKLTVEISETFDSMRISSIFKNPISRIQVQVSALFIFEPPCTERYAWWCERSATQLSPGCHKDNNQTITHDRLIEKDCCLTR